MKSPKKSSELVLGLMSGTSLDGLDMALCEFNDSKNKFEFTILKAKTLVYNKGWQDDLKQAPRLSAENYFALHAKYGKFLGECVNDFLIGVNERPLAIASHGHTVFHRPELGFSTQLGCGASLAAETGITTVCDFRSLDVALGGQGAPLVPIGDRLLFHDYPACLNLGGIANLSFDDANGERRAYDVCETNLLLNYLSQKIHLHYDEYGGIARGGRVRYELLEVLNSLDFYGVMGAKSLGREWFEKEVRPHFEENQYAIQDLLCTAVEHISDIIANELNRNKLKKVLLTGGGAYNHFLIERIREKTNAHLVIPGDDLIQFKEALVFAFLGYLRLNQKINTLSSVTAASRDSVGGAIYFI